jgi:mannose-6-phosphate isomerase-like protein (cupin superfamily)
MDIKAYINSGILQEYALNILSAQERSDVEYMCAAYPEIKKELERIEDSLENFARENSVQPPAELKDTIWATLQNLNKEKEMDPNDLPFINRFTDHTKWLRFVQSKLPESVTEDRIVTILTHNSLVTQALVISRTDFEPEEHENEMESFVILQGECECTVGDNVFRLGPGGFTEIPLHTPHSVKMLTPHVVAILQRVAI